MKTALLSVYNKTGVVEFAQRLRELGFNIIASGGTAKALACAGIEVKDVADIVGEPILGHRVVTLSREIHAALLAKNIEADNAELVWLGIPRIDLVYVNMYPLAEEIANPERTLESVIEKTDIGGPTMLRSAAKGRRIVMCEPSQIPEVLKEIEGSGFMFDGEIDEKFISRLVSEVEEAVSLYCHTSSQFHREFSQGHV